MTLSRKELIELMAKTDSLVLPIINSIAILIIGTAVIAGNFADRDRFNKLEQRMECPR